MVDSEYNIDTYKSVKISIGAVMKYPEMLKFVPNSKYVAANYGVPKILYQLGSRIKKNFSDTYNHQRIKC